MQDLVHKIIFGVGKCNMLKNLSCYFVQKAIS